MLNEYWPAAVVLNVMRASPVVGLGYTAIAFNASVWVNGVSTVSSVRALSMPASASASSERFTLTDLVEATELPHPLVRVTLTVPATVPQVTLMVLVPWPSVMVQPAGTVQL